MSPSDIWAGAMLPSPWHCCSCPTILCTYATLSMVVFLFSFVHPSPPNLLGTLPHPPVRRCATPSYSDKSKSQVDRSTTVIARDVEGRRLLLNPLLMTQQQWFTNCWSISVTVILLTHCFDNSNIIEYFSLFQSLYYKPYHMAHSPSAVMPSHHSWLQYAWWS